MITKSQIIVHVCVIFFGIGSWLAINGTFIELPLMVSQLPEGWTLSSYIAVMVQLGNIAPLLLTVYNHFSNRKLSDTVVVYIIYIIGAVACLLLSFFWNHITDVAGTSRSIPFFVLVFFQATVDCASAVVFLPYMVKLKQQYMTSLFVGQGLSGVIPAVVGLIQGAGEMTCMNITNTSTSHSSDNLKSHILSQNGTDTSWFIKAVYAEPLFDVSGFFIFLSIVTVLCGVAFFILNKLPICKQEHVNEHKKQGKKYPMSRQSSSSETTPLRVGSVDKPELDQCTDREDQKCKNMSETSVDKIGSNECLSSNNKDIVEQSKAEFNDEKLAIKIVSQYKQPDRQKLMVPSVVFGLTVFLLINSLTNGVLVSVQPYATMPYSLNTFHLITIIFKIVPVFATSAAYVKSVKRISVLSTFMFFGLCGSVYITTAAAYSPTPWLAGETSGAVIMGICWTLTSAMFSYVSVCVANIIRSKGRQALFWCGVVKQVGSAIGSLMMFFIISLGDVFVSAPKCPGG